MADLARDEVQDRPCGDRFGARNGHTWPPARVSVPRVARPAAMSGA